MTPSLTSLPPPSLSLYPRTNSAYLVSFHPAMLFDLTGGGGLDPSRQKALLYNSGSFSGYWQPSTPEHLETLSRTGYLTATESFKQPLCGNAEGWGPLSRLRYDFTPCFLDVWLASVAAFGLVLGLGTVVWLIKKRKPQEVAMGWHFWTKQVCVRLWWHPNDERVA